MNVLSYIKAQWDRVGAWMCVALGAVALVVGWIGVSGTAYPAEQMPYIVSGGLAGLFLLGVGAMLWLSADLRDEWHKLDALHADVQGNRAAGPETQHPEAPSRLAVGP